MGTKVCNKCNIEKDVTEFYSSRKKCKTCIIEYQREYNQNNKEKRKKYLKENKEKISKKGKEYYQKNIEKMNRKVYERRKRKMKNDLVYRLKIKLRKKIRESLKNNGYTKKSNTYTILGCSYKDFKIYIESNWEGWMSWDNYGLYNGEENYGWDLDHIVPLSSAQCEEDIIRLNHHSNIQPLCSHINRNVKRDNIDWK